MDWEFDKRRGNLCQHSMLPGEELVWYEVDPRFNKNEQVKKTLRRLRGAMTFLVQDRQTDKVLTVGTMTFLDD